MEIQNGSNGESSNNKAEASTERQCSGTEAYTTCTKQG
jgi:hypothetical protein